MPDFFTSLSGRIIQLLAIVLGTFGCNNSTSDSSTAILVDCDLIETMKSLNNNIATGIEREVHHNSRIFTKQVNTIVYILDTGEKFQVTQEERMIQVSSDLQPYPLKLVINESIDSVSIESIELTPNWDWTMVWGNIYGCNDGVLGFYYWLQKPDTFTILY